MVPPMRRLLLMLLVPLFGCPAPEPIDCTRNLIDVSGFANGGFAGGFGGAGGSTGTGGSSGAPEDPVGLVGKPARFTVFAPLSACDPDVLRADVTLVDPDNEPVEFNVDGAIARSGEQHAVSGTFSFTPLKPGVHILRVSFEPSLGVRSVLFDVASDGLVNPTTRVPIPAGANCTVWPLTDDTVACEERGGFVSITSVDGGLTRFPGAELVVADNVLWSIDGTSSTLERRIYEDGGVRVTHRFPSFPLMPTPGLHEADLALRYRSNRLITRVRISRGVASLGDFAVDPFISPPLAYFIEPDDTLPREQLRLFLHALHQLAGPGGARAGPGVAHHQRLRFQLGDESVRAAAAHASPCALEFEPRAVDGPRLPRSRVRANSAVALVGGR